MARSISRRWPHEKNGPIDRGQSNYPHQSQKSISSKTLAYGAGDHTNGPDLGDGGGSKVGAIYPVAERCRFHTTFMPKSRHATALPAPFSPICVVFATLRQQSVAAYLPLPVMWFIRFSAAGVGMWPDLRGNWV
jgi:hypothetical protein